MLAVAGHYRRRGQRDCTHKMRVLAKAMGLMAAGMFHCSYVVLAGMETRMVLQVLHCTRHLHTASDQVRSDIQVHEANHRCTGRLDRQSLDGTLRKPCQTGADNLLGGHTASGVHDYHRA